MSRTTKIAGLLAVVLVGVFLYWIDPVQYKLVPKCPFKILTGLSCPGCGFQRAVHALLHGRFVEAINYNLYLIFAVPYALVVCINQWFVPSPYREKYAKYVEHKIMVNTYVVTFFLWLIIRNILNI